MSKTFSILKSLDITKLDKQIKEYECTTGEVPYLFMANLAIQDTLHRKYHCLQ